MNWIITIACLFLPMFGGAAYLNWQWHRADRKRNADLRAWIARQYGG